VCLKINVKVALNFFAQYSDVQYIYLNVFSALKNYQQGQNKVLKTRNSLLKIVFSKNANIFETIDSSKKLHISN